MEYVTLKHSDLKVSRLCMGGCPMGGYGWGESNEADFLAAIHAALDMGVNYFDTADTYGLGQSERTLSKGLGTHRHEVIIQSKFGVKAWQGPTTYDNSPAYIRQALEQTLLRLNTDYLDIYVVHYWDGKTLPEEITGTLAQLVQEGKIRSYGLSNLAPEQLPRWNNPACPPINAQYEFSLACRSNEASLRAAINELDVTPLTWGSLGQGILTGKYDASARFSSNDRRSRDVYVNFHGEKLLHNLEIVELLRQSASAHEKSIASCAIRFILDYWKDSVVIAGVKSANQLRSNVETMGWHLTEQEITRLDMISKGEAYHDSQTALA